jgi:MmyB-like transcription regulator ligand binding domain
LLQTAPFHSSSLVLLLKPPVNVLRLSLHPGGLAPRIANLPEWRWHLLSRLRRQVDVSADPVLAELFNELSSYPLSGGKKHEIQKDHAAVAVPFQFTTDSGILSFLSTTTVFGTPVDITLSELALESFFPANSATADALSRMASK